MCAGVVSVRSGTTNTLSALYEAFLNERSVLEVVLGGSRVVRVLAGWASFRHTFALPALS